MTGALVGGADELGEQEIEGVYQLKGRAIDRGNVSVIGVSHSTGALVGGADELGEP